MPHQITYNLRHELPDPHATCIFNHIYKCGGTTLYKNLAQCFPSSQYVFLGSPLNENHFNKNAKFYYFHDVSGIEHTLCLEKFYYITFLREPFKKTLSYLKFSESVYPLAEMSQGTTEKRIYNYPANQYISFLGNGDKHLAEENLFKNYAFFGIVEHYNRSIEILSQYIPKLKDISVTNYNISSKKIEQIYNPLAVEYFYEKNRDDVELYEKALKEFFKRAAQSSPKELTTEIISSPVGQSFKHVNKKEEFLAHSLHLLENVVCDEDFSSIDAKDNSFDLDFLNCFLSLRNLQSHRKLYQWLMQRIEQRPSCLLMAYLCAQHASLPELYTITQQCFNAINTFDPNCHMRALVQFRLECIRTLATRNLWVPTKDFDKSLLHWLENLAQKRPWKAKSLYIQSLPYSSEQNWKKAFCLLKEAILLMPQDLCIREGFCNAALALGGEYTKELEQEAKQALLHDENCEWALRQMVFLLHAQDDKQSLMCSLEKALAKNPYWQKGWELRVQTQAHLDGSRLLDMSNTMTNLSLDASSAYYLHCQYLCKQGLEQEALYCIEQVARVHYRWINLYMLASDIAQKLCDESQALAFAQKAVQCDPVALSARLHFLQMLLHANKYEEISAMANQGSVSYPLEGWPQMAQALVSESQGNLVKSLQYMYMALQKQPEKITFMREYARLLRISKSWDLLSPFCKHAIAKNENHGWAWKELCYVAIAQGSMLEAKRLGEISLAKYADEEFKTFFRRNFLKKS